VKKLSIPHAFLSFSQLINFSMTLGFVSGFQQRLRLQILPAVDGFHHAGHEDRTLFLQKIGSRVGFVLRVKLKASTTMNCGCCLWCVLCYKGLLNRPRS